MNKLKIKIDENMVKNICSGEKFAFRTIYVIFNDDIRLFLKNKNYFIGFIKKPINRKLFITDSDDGIFIIENDLIKTMFFKTVGFYLEFENEKDMLTFKLKYS